MLGIKTIDLQEMHAKSAVKELAQAQLKTLDGIDYCIGCGLSGPDNTGPDGPWRFTFRFETDETICKGCGRDYEHFSARRVLYMLTTTPQVCTEVVV